ncbi:MAG: translocation/assembly module TamB domain-containing protein [Saprospiraceae bacterium]|nr:translocation/assembly module TamB domain-containing protein [Saprospiraceae bacterium]
MKDQSIPHKIARRKENSIWEVVFSTLILILFSWVILSLVVKLPIVQNYIKERLLTWVNQNFDQDIQLNNLTFDISTGIQFKLLIKDHHQDTLFYAEEFFIDPKNLLSLAFKPELELKVVKGNQIRFNIKNYPGEDDSNLQIFINKFKSGNSKSKAFSLMVHTLTLFKVRTTLNNPQMEVSLNLDKLHLRMDSMDLSSTFFHFRSVVLDNPNVHVIMKENPLKDSLQLKKDELETDPEFCSPGLALFFSFINCNHGKFTFENPSQNQFKSFDAINFSSTYAYYSPDLLRMEFLTLNAIGDRGFQLKDLHVSNFNYNPYEISLGKFLLKTNHSSILLKGNIQSGSSALKETDYSDWVSNLQIDKAQIGPNDISYFMENSELLNILTLDESIPVNISANIIGTIKSLILKSVQINYGHVFALDGSGQIRNALSGTDALVNFKFKSAFLNSDFGYQLLKNPSIPKSYKNLGNIQFTGNFDGYLSDFVAFGNFKTNLGSIQSDIKVALKKDITKSSYSGNVNASGFELGKLLDIKDLGQIDIRAGISNGKGLTKESVDATFTADIKSIEFKNILIKELKFDGILKSDLLKGQLQLNDEQVKAVINGEVHLLGSNWNASIKSEISRLQLGLINAQLNQLILSGNVIANLRQNQNKEFIGSIKAEKLTYSDSVETVYLDHLLIEQHFQKSLRTIKFDSDILTFQAVGFFDIATIGKDIIGYLDSKHKHLMGILMEPAKTAANPISCNANIFIKDGITLNKILKLPFSTHLMDLDLLVDSRKDLFELKSNRFDILYKNIKLDKVSFSVRSNEMLKFLLTFDALKEKDINRTGNGKVAIQLGNGTGNMHIQLFDGVNKKILTNLLSAIDFTKEQLSLILKDEDLYFNDTKWHVNPKNLIQYKRDYLNIQNLELSDSTHFISVRDFDHKGLVLNTDGFSLDLVNHLLKSETVYFGGIFSTKISIPNLNNFKDAHGEINVVDFMLNKSHFGPLRVSFEIPDPSEPWNINLTSKFKDQHLIGKGTLNIPNSSFYKYSPFDFDVLFNLKQFPMSFLENFLDPISNSKGGGDGIMRFYTEKNKLNLEGKINISEASTYINYLGVPVHMTNQEINFYKKSISFNNTQMKDKLGNPLTVEGNIFHTNLKDWVLDVRVKSDKALVLETDKTNKEAYYGYGIGKVDALFLGPVTQLQMDVDLVSTKGSRLFIPMTSSNETERAEFVQFIDRSAEKKVVLNTVVSNSKLTGLNVNMQLTLTEDAEVSVIFDEQTGDILKGKGRGNLQIKSLRNGLFTVNGDFEVEQGQYLFTLYNFVNKPFTLTRGGIATWTGDPLNANINIEAVYEGLQAAPYLLIQEYLGENQELIEEAKRRTSVKLKMLLTGSLLKPTITFDLELPDLTGSLKNYAENKIGYLKLNQDQFNQQIFGLLVLGSFLNNTNPWEGGLIGNLGTTTINTMSEMLSNQFSLFVTNLLNNAFDDVNFISGIDFNIGYDIDNTKVGGTNLNETEVVFSLKHRLWNDQWIVTLGGNYKSNSQLLGNSYFNPESVIEWNTPVQGLKMRVYYRGDESIEGIKHKVGAGVNIRKEFDKIFSGK